METAMTTAALPVGVNVLPNDNENEHTYFHQVELAWHSFVNQRTQSNGASYTSRFLHFADMAFDRQSIQFLMEHWVRDLRLQKGNLPSIDSLHLHDCQFDSAETIRYFLQLLEQLPTRSSLKELCIQGGITTTTTTVSEEANDSEESDSPSCLLETLLIGARMLPELQTIRLNGLDLEHLGPQVEALVPGLQELDVSDSVVDNEFWEHLRHGISRSPYGMKAINVSWTNLATEQLILLVDTMASSSTRNSLESLILDGNRVGADSFPALARLLSDFESLSTLSFIACSNLFQQLGDRRKEDGRLFTFTDALHYNTSLQTLQMDNVHWTGRLAKPVFKALTSKHTSVQHLSTSGFDDLSSVFAETVPQMLSLRKITAHLDLECHSLSKALKENTSLTCVNYQTKHNAQSSLKHILVRNQSIHTMSSILQRLNGHDATYPGGNPKESLTSTNWPLCMEQLTLPTPKESCKNESVQETGASAVYAFLHETSSMLPWIRREDKF